jgi:hypothetical protein
VSVKSTIAVLSRLKIILSECSNINACVLIKRKTERCTCKGDIYWFSPSYIWLKPQNGHIRRSGGKHDIDYPTVKKYVMFLYIRLLSYFNKHCGRPFLLSPIDQNQCKTILYLSQPYIRRRKSIYILQTISIWSDF